MKSSLLLCLEKDREGGRGGRERVRQGRGREGGEGEGGREGGGEMVHVREVRHM